MKAKTVCWMARSSSGKLMPFAASTSREMARGRYMELFSPDRTWKWLYRRGHRIVRVNVTEQ